MVYFEVRSWCISQANQIGNNGGGTINYISFNPSFLFVCLFGSNFYCLDYVFLIRKTFSFLKHDCLMALTMCLNLHCKMHFPAIYSMQNFDTFWPTDPTMKGIQAKLKLVKFYENFSRYNFEKLIRILQSCVFAETFLYLLLMQVSIEFNICHSIDLNWKYYHVFHW